VFSWNNFEDVKNVLMKLNDLEMITHPSSTLHKKSYYHIYNKEIDVTTNC
jgi:hypothetical protein